MCRIPSFLTLSLMAATLLTAAGAHAGSVVLITNLDPTAFPVTTVSPTAVTGESFIAGTTMALMQVKIEIDPNNMPTSAPRLVLESSIKAVDGNNQNFNAPDGVVYTGLTLTSTDTSTGILTYTATTPFTMTAGSNYWLVATPTGTDTGLAWDLTHVSNPSTLAPYDYTIQSNDASFYSNPGGPNTYVNPGDGVQLFQLSGQGVPEPPTISLAAVAVCALCAFECRRVRSRRGNSRPGKD